MDSQDWKPVNIGNGKAASAQIQAKKPVFIQGAGQPKIIKTEDGEEVVQSKKITSVTSQAIMQARAAKSLTQKELAAKCSLDVKIISDCEKVGTKYNWENVNKIAKALGVKIPRE
jgi:ribosome-binding protein aMBF1 (putative translation factor)